MSDVARKRWRLLGDILCKRGVRKSTNVSSVSVRRFVTFGLFTTKPTKCAEADRLIATTDTGTDLTNGGDSYRKRDNGLDEVNVLADCKRFKTSENHSVTQAYLCNVQSTDVVTNIETICVEDLPPKVVEADCERDFIKKSGVGDSRNSSAVMVEDSPSNHIWFNYTSQYFLDLSLDVRHLNSSITLQDLLGFNNTGNVCVWPSEEVLAYYCLRHSYMFKDSAVCELGGGMTCLAAFSIAVTTQAKRILATDGNISSVLNLKEILNRNKSQFKADTVEARLLLWDDEECLAGLDAQFDFIVCADCLFFDEFRRPLLRTISRLLKPKGRAIMFAPSRGGTLDKFVDLVSASSDTFEISTRTDNYDDVIDQLHSQNLSKGIDCYDESLHYPRLLTFTKL